MANSIIEHNRKSQNSDTMDNLLIELNYCRSKYELVDINFYDDFNQGFIYDTDISKGDLIRLQKYILYLTNMSIGIDKYICRMVYKKQVSWNYYDETPELIKVYGSGYKKCMSIKGNISGKEEIVDKLFNNMFSVARIVYSCYMIDCNDFKLLSDNKLDVDFSIMKYDKICVVDIKPIPRESNISSKVSHEGKIINSKIDNAEFDIVFSIISKDKLLEKHSYLSKSFKRNDPVLMIRSKKYIADIIKLWENNWFIRFIKYNKSYSGAKEKANLKRRYYDEKFINKVINLRKNDLSSSIKIDCQNKETICFNAVKYKQDSCDMKGKPPLKTMTAQAKSLLFNIINEVLNAKHIEYNEEKIHILNLDNNLQSTLNDFMYCILENSKNICFGMGYFFDLVYELFLVSSKYIEDKIVLVSIFCSFIQNIDFQVKKDYIDKVNKCELRLYEYYLSQSSEKNNLDSDKCKDINLCGIGDDLKYSAKYFRSLSCILGINENKRFISNDDESNDYIFEKEISEYGYMQPSEDQWSLFTLPNILQDINVESVIRHKENITKTGEQLSKCLQEIEELSVGNGFI